MSFSLRQSSSSEIQHTRWNVFQICYVYFIYPSGKEPIKGVCEREAELGRQMDEPFHTTKQTNQVFPAGGAS